MDSYNDPGCREPRASVGRTLCAALLAGSLASLGSAAPLQEDDFEPRAFQLYDQPVVREMVEELEEHVAAARWPEALVLLQDLLQDHRAHVLGATRPKATDARHPSQGDVHEGASQWALERLFSLPAEARELYRERHGQAARRSLERALLAGDRRALTDVARRWPLTDASLRAWWALGDLEIERGQQGDGLRAWARGAATLLGRPTDVAGTPDDWRHLRDALAAADAPEGARARVQFALAALSGEGAVDVTLGEPESGFVAGVASGSLLDPRGFGSEGWPSEWRPPKGTVGNPYDDEKSGSLLRLQPARDASALYVNTGRSVHAISAFGGQSLWSFGPDELGWDKVPFRSARRVPVVDDFDDALDRTDHIVGAAVAQGTVVAAVQLPLAYEKTDDYQRIEIIDILPERRLVGLDSETGALRWQHFPPQNWDGDSGSFEERLTVVGPPRIVGSRVLAPVAHQRGRIKLALGCYDLDSGELLWSTDLVTGQVPLNMFGRQVKEFSAPPVEVAGAKVLVQTNLGVIAAVDLFTGDVLWQTVYPQIEIRKPTYYEVGSLDSTWRNAPPIAVGDVLISTPTDCDEMLGLDLDTGAILWSAAEGTLESPEMRSRWRNRRGYGDESPPPLTLVGADERQVYVSSRQGTLMAFRPVSDFRRSAPVRHRWSYPGDAGALVGGDTPTPAIDGQHAYVPGLTELTVLDVDSGSEVARIPGALGSGNLLVTGGALFAVTAENVTAAFEWSGMVERAVAALAKNPNDPRKRSELARLYLESGEAAALEGDGSRARRMYNDARRVLEEGRASEKSASHLLRVPLYRVLRAEARLLRRSTDWSSAEARLRTAFDVAPDPEMRRDALLALQAVQRQRASEPAAKEAWDATLDELLAGFGGDSIHVTYQPALGWAPGGAGGRSPDPWVGTLVPDAARADESVGNGGPGRRARLELAVWVGLERTAEANRQGDHAAEAAQLFWLLDGHGAADLPGGGDDPLRLWASGRLGLLRLRADASVFEPYERRADELLAKAIDDDSATMRRTTLESVASRYPGTRAARRANGLRLDAAVAEGDVSSVARIVLGGIPIGTTVGTASPGALQELLRLAQVAGAAGNLELRAALGDQLAVAAASARVELQAGGEPLAGAVARWRAAAQPAPPSTSTVGPDAVKRADLGGPFQPLGTTLRPDGSSLLVLVSNTQLIAVSPAADRGGPVWKSPIENRLAPQALAEMSRLSQNTVHVAGPRRLEAFDARDGAPLWSWTPPEDHRIDGLQASDGVLLLEVRRRTDATNEMLVALGEVSGVELWRRVTTPGTAPICGDGRLALLQERSDEAQIVDLFLGGSLGTLEVGPMTLALIDKAWIHDGRLVVPQYFREGEAARHLNHIQAFDLVSLRPDWRIDLSTFRGSEHSLQAVLEYAPPGVEPRRLCVLRSTGRNGQLGRRSVHVLNERLGALDHAALFDLRSAEDQEIVGVQLYGHKKLDHPVLFVSRAERNSGHYSVAAIDLYRGKLWEERLPRPTGKFGFDNMPQPLVARDAIAVAYASNVRSGNRVMAEWELTFLDRATGNLLESRTLSRKEENARWLQIAPVGEGMVLVGARRTEFFE